MKSTIRCFISCILPCGVLDVIRIVHANGRVEEISGTVKAAELMKAYPKHVLKKPSSSSEEGLCPKIVIVPPDDQLQRGKIYFLMPVAASSAPEKTRPRSSAKTSSTRRTKKKEAQINASNNNNNNHNNDKSISMNNPLISDDRYLSEILSEKHSTQKDRRRGRAALWRPHLESISEMSSEA